MIRKKYVRWMLDVMRREWLDEEERKEIRWRFEKIKQEYDIRPVRLPEEQTFARLLLTPLQELGLSTRPYFALRRNGIDTIGKLLSMREDKVRGLRLVGKSSWEEIERALEKHGGRLAPPKIITDFEKWLGGGK